MSDLISISTLLEAMENLRKDNRHSDAKSRAQHNSEITACIKRVVEQPTVEAVPVVHGEWIHVPSSDMETGKAYECSNCKKMRYDSFLPPFCQMCGADMRKKV